MSKVDRMLEKLLSVLIWISEAEIPGGSKARDIYEGGEEAEETDPKDNKNPNLAEVFSDIGNFSTDDGELENHILEANDFVSAGNFQTASGLFTFLLKSLWFKYWKTYIYIYDKNGCETKPPILEWDKTAILKTGQNRRFW